MADLEGDCGRVLACNGRREEEEDVARYEPCYVTVTRPRHQARQSSTTEYNNTQCRAWCPPAPANPGWRRKSLLGGNSLAPLNSYYIIHGKCLKIFSSGTAAL